MFDDCRVQPEYHTLLLSTLVYIYWFDTIISSIYYLLRGHIVITRALLYE